MSDMCATNCWLQSQHDIAPLLKGASQRPVPCSPAGPRHQVPRRALPRNRHLSCRNRAGRTDGRCCSLCPRRAPVLGQSKSACKSEAGAEEVPEHPQVAAGAGLQGLIPARAPCVRCGCASSRIGQVSRWIPEGRIKLAKLGTRESSRWGRRFWMSRSLIPHCSEECSGEACSQGCPRFEPFRDLSRDRGFDGRRLGQQYARHRHAGPHVFPSVVGASLMCGGFLKPWTAFRANRPDQARARLNIAMLMIDQMSILSGGPAANGFLSQPSGACGRDRSCVLEAAGCAVGRVGAFPASRRSRVPRQTEQACAALPAQRARGGRGSQQPRGGSKSQNSAYSGLKPRGPRLGLTLPTSLCRHCGIRFPGS